LFAEKKLNIEILELKYSGTILINSRTIKDIFDKEYSKTIVVVEKNRSLPFGASFIQQGKLEKKKFVYEINNENKKILDIIPKIANEFGLKQFYLMYRDKLVDVDQTIEDFFKNYDPNSEDVNVEPRKVFVRYGNRNAIEVDVSNCLTVASFMKEIKKRISRFKGQGIQIAI